MTTSINYYYVRALCSFCMRLIIRLEKSKAKMCIDMPERRQIKDRTSI